MGIVPELWELDPVSEDADNSPLELGVANGMYPTALECPPPERERIFAASADTEGDPFVAGRWRNREITLKVRVSASTHATLEGYIQALVEKVTKIGREGGTFKRTTTGSGVIVFDLLDGDVDLSWDWQYTISKNVEATMKLIAKPFGRGPEEDLGDNTETSSPCLVFTDTGIKGDVPALGRLVIDNDESADQWSVVWGVQSRHYAGTATAGLFYEAETRLPMGGGSVTAGPTGASGGTVVRQSNLNPTYQAILSTASSGTAHLSHVGDFNVYARVFAGTANAGTVSVGLEWAEGDFRRFAQNTPTTFPVGSWEGSWRIVDLGQVRLGEATAGAQRWEGRVLAKSTTAGDNLDVDWLMLVPVTEGWGKADAVLSVQSPGTFSARDEFDQTAGNLNGKTAPVGGNWVTSGSATDLAVEITGHTAEKTATSENMRYAISGASAMAATVTQVDVKFSAARSNVYQASIARWTDSSNYLRAMLFFRGDLTPAVQVSYWVGGAIYYLGDGVQGTAVSAVADCWYTIRLVVDAAGRGAVWFFPQGSGPGDPIATFQSSVFATGGTLASGKVGFGDENNGVLACTRNYDNFAAWVPTTDAAMFASQSLEVRHDRVRREDSAGALWVTPSRYEGNYLRLPPAGREGRSVRTIVKASRGSFDGELPDTAIDDISARLYYTPRYLVVPGTEGGEELIVG